MRAEVDVVVQILAGVLAFVAAWAALGGVRIVNQVEPSALPAGPATSAGIA